MCIICIDLARGKIRSKDALNNMLERIDEIDDKHLERILDLINVKQLEEKQESG
jgi:hypothetical protein|tara:strand:- start:1680 stop:1841 length:162 start_codon:yes stop_codon:yes gene_type:complete